MARYNVVVQGPIDRKTGGRSAQRIGGGKTLDDAKANVEGAFSLYAGRKGYDVVVQDEDGRVVERLDVNATARAGEEEEDDAE